MTLESVHYGHAEAIQLTHQAALDAAFFAHPERFKDQRPKPPELPTAACIKSPSKEPATRAIA